MGTQGRRWAQQGAFQAEGTAIPSPGLCLEASPGTCIFPGHVCVCVGGQVPSLVGEDPTCCVTWKKKKRLWPARPVRQVGAGMEGAGETSARQKRKAAGERTGSSLGAPSGPCPRTSQLQWTQLLAGNTVLATALRSFPT